MLKESQTKASVFKPVERMSVTSLEVLKTLADPFRIQIIELLRTPQTVKSIAKQLGVSATKLYYHINMLEQHNLICVTSTRVVSGIVEKSYQVTAESFDVSPSFSSPQVSLEDALNMMTSVLDSGKLEMQRAYNSGKFKLPNQSDTPKQTMLLTRSILRLTPARAKQFREGMSNLLKEFGDDQSKNAQDYSLTIAYHPTVTREIPEGGKGPKKARKS